MEPEPESLGRLSFVMWWWKEGEEKVSLSFSMVEVGRKKGTRERESRDWKGGGRWKELLISRRRAQSRTRRPF